MAGTFRFRGKLEEVDTRALISTVVYLPASIMKKLPRARVRTKGTMNGAPFALAVQYRKEARSFFIVSKSLRKAAKIVPGSPVEVEFRIVSDKVEVPEELAAVLAQDPDGMKAWKKLTPGLQRGLCHYVTSVRNVDSRISRALLLVNKMKLGGFNSSGRKKTEDAE